MTECANCGNERIMLCPFCEHDFSERSKNNEAELRQLRREVALLREAEKALGYYADRKTYTYDNGLDEIRVLVDGGNRARTALKALEAAREG